MEQVPIVCEYPDVSPEDLPEFPPKHELEFMAKLACETMAPIEFKELKKQLMELIDRGFVRSSVSS